MWPCFHLHSTNHFRVRPEDFNYVLSERDVTSGLPGIVQTLYGEILKKAVTLTHLHSSYERSSCIIRLPKVSLELISSWISASESVSSTSALAIVLQFIIIAHERFAQIYPGIMLLKRILDKYRTIDTWLKSEVFLPTEPVQFQVVGK